MLTSLRLRNFKSFADAQAPFGPLTLLVGANASGKSNVLDALRVLKGLVAEGLSLEQVLQGATGWPGIRGGMREVVRSGADAFAVESTWEFAAEQGASNSAVFDYLLECVVTPHPLLRRERLPQVDDELKGYGVELPENRIEAQYSELPNMAIMPPGRGIPISGWAYMFVQMLGGLRFYDVVPSTIRNYVPQTAQELGENAEGLSAILWQLCREPENKQELVDWLAELCSPELADIDFSTTDEDEVMLRLIEKDGSRVSARSLSDGTLRFLGELVALRTAPEGSIILLEELGRELHPSRVHLLVEYLESITEERKIQVIATTHSPLVLQALSPKARKDVVVLGRVPDVPGTIMKWVGDLPRFEEVVERRGMDYLFTTNWLEQALEGLGSKWQGLLQVCPEIAELKQRIAGWLDSQAEG